jgi:hypothetical protein
MRISAMIELLVPVAAGFVAAALSAVVWFRYSNSQHRNRRQRSWGREDQEVRRLRDS